MVSDGGLVLVKSLIRLVRISWLISNNSNVDSLIVSSIMKFENKIMKMHLATCHYSLLMIILYQPIVLFIPNFYALTNNLFWLTQENLMKILSDNGKFSIFKSLIEVTKNTCHKVIP